MTGAEGARKQDQTAAEGDAEAAQKVHREAHAAEVAAIAGPAVTAEAVLAVRRAELVTFTYSPQGHMGG